MEKRLGDIYPNIQDFISLQDIRRDDIESACRRDLRIVDPQHDMERIEKSKDELLDDAFKWILEPYPEASLAVPESGRHHTHFFERREKWWFIILRIIT